MKKSVLNLLLMIGVAVTLTLSLTACGGGEDGTIGADGADGAAGTDLTALTPNDTYFSVVVTDNGHHHIGDNLLYLDFVAEGGTAATAVTGTENDWVTAMHTNDMTGNIVVDGSISDWPSTSLTTIKGVGWEGSYNNTTYSIDSIDISVGVAYDDNYVYMVAQYADADQSIGRKQWVYNTATADSWDKTSSGANADEDRFFVLFPITDGEGAWVAGGTGCVSYCHAATSAGGEHMGMNTTGDRLDAWHWKGVRTRSTNTLQDKHWIVAGYDGTTFLPVNGRKGDSGIGTSITNEGGVGCYDCDGWGIPAYINVAGPHDGTAASNFVLWEENAVPLTARDSYTGWVDANTDTIVDAGEFAAQAFANDDMIPYEMLRVPSGSTADVTVVSSYSSGMWTLEMIRARDTGDGDDAQFIGGGTDATAPTAAADVTIATAAAAGAPSSCIACHPLDGSGSNPNLQDVAAGLLYAAPGNASGDSGTMAGITAITTKEAVDLAAAYKQ